MSLFTPTGFRIGLCQVGPCGVRRCDHLQRRPHPQLPLHRRPEGGVVGVARAGDHRDALRALDRPVIARVEDDTTFVDLRTVHPDDDEVVIDALRSLA